MPVEFGLWRTDGGFRRVQATPIGSEAQLEQLLFSDPDSLLGLDVLPLARQVSTAYGKRIALVAIDADGDLFAVELKRSRTPRDVVAQVLDYGSWLKGLTYPDVKHIFEDAHPNGLSFESTFAARFGDSPPEVLNEQHHLVIVASDFDPGTERIVQYLANDFHVPVNTLIFRHFEDDDRQYLTRIWVVDPTLWKGRLDAARGAASHGMVATITSRSANSTIGDGRML